MVELTGGEAKLTWRSNCGSIAAPNQVSTVWRVSKCSRTLEIERQVNCLVT